MASAKKTDAINESNIDAEIQALLDQAIQAEGVKKDDIVELLGLTPIYAPKEAFENKFPPLVGDIDRIEVLPTIRTGKENEYSPIMLRVVTSQATKALQGTKEDRKIIDLPAGSEVLLPVTGGLGVNRKLEAYATDRDSVHRVAVVVTGSMDVGQPQNMFTFKVIDLPTKKVKRVGRFSEPFVFRNFDGAMFDATVAAPQMNGATQSQGASA